MLIRNLSILIFLFFYFPIAYGDNLNQLLSSLKTLQANFIQTTFDNHGKAIQQSRGKMALSRPGKFRWEVVEPIPQLIIANGSRLWIYDPDLEQVTIRALTTTAGETPALLLSQENATLNKDFNTHSKASNKNGLNWFELIPKNKDSMFASIQMVFNKEAIQQMNLKDHLGHSTQVKFINTRINQAIPEKVFNFHIPKNIDVIDETSRSH